MKVPLGQAPSAHCDNTLNPHEKSVNYHLICTSGILLQSQNNGTIFFRGGPRGWLFGANKRSSAAGVGTLTVNSGSVDMTSAVTALDNNLQLNGGVVNISNEFMTVNGAINVTGDATIKWMEK